MILILGEILFDLFPDQKRMGEVPFDFAYHPIKQMVAEKEPVTKISCDINLRSNFYTRRRLNY